MLDPATMARFNAWANAHIYDSVAELDEEAYRADRGAFFGSVHGTLNHILVVDRLWLDRLEGRRDSHIRSLDQILYDDLASLRAAQAAEDQRLIRLAESMDERRLATPVTYTTLARGREECYPAAAILGTLYNHQTHHRGQIHCLLTQSGIEPPPLDIIVFLDHDGA